jgi:hypothetical protein
VTAPASRDPYAARTRAELAEAREVEGLFARVVAAAALADVPYTRPGYPDWMLFTSKQWDSYLGWQAVCDRSERKYGRLLPQSSAVLALQRRIF